MNRHIKQIVPFIVCLLLTASLQAAEQGYFIVNTNVPVDTLTKKEILTIFLGNKQFWSNDKRIEAAYCADKDADLFFNDYLDISHKAFKRHWLKKVFSGYGTAPKSLRNPQAIVEFVSSHEGAIAFCRGISLEGKKNIKVISVKQSDTDR